jgi:uncharacterized small protein (DUF1192 family)
MSMGIYRIRNTITGKIYVGSSTNIEHRWRGHVSHLKAGDHTNRDLQHDWLKHGEEAFECVIVEPSDEPATLLERERHWTLECIRSGNCYNMPEVAYSGVSEASLPSAILQNEIALLRASRAELDAARQAYAVARRELPHLAALERGTPEAPLQEFAVVLVLAIATHQRTKARSSAAGVPWAIKNLQGDKMLNGALICRLSQDDAQLLGRMFDRLGLVVERQPRQAGRWVPKTTDEVVSLVSKNWGKVSGLTSVDLENVGSTDGVKD